MTRQRVMNHMLMDLVDVGGLHASTNIGPSSGKGLELYSPGATTSYIQSYDRTGGAWMDLYLQASNIYVNPMASGGGRLYIGGATANKPYLRMVGSDSLSVEAPNQYVMLHSKSGTHIGGNIYWDGANWNRYDTAQTLTLLVASPGSIAFYTGSSGSNPATYTGAMSIPQATGLLQAAGWQNVTYQNGFSHQTGWQQCQYMRTPTGMVRFRGLLMSPASGWGHAVPAFTLPVGYRLGIEPGPQTYHHFGTLSDSALLGGITIHSNGVFSPWMAAGQATTGVHWWDLAGISYMSESLG